uniref:Hydroxymethylglutaryl-CoA reductase-like domain-containing protein n=1 Tax=Thermofilum pendens TaxID=2269 RepID=A0A7C3WL80_THEPE
MAYIPKALLRRLYVKGSMQVTSEGLSLKLRNSLAPAAINAPIKITIDDVPVDPANVKVFINDREVVEPPSDEKPLEVPVGSEITLLVKGNYTKGKHKVVIGVSVKGYGEGSFDIEDEAA